MKLLIAGVAGLLLLTGCTTYEVKREEGSELSVKSWREFPEGLRIKYESPQGSKLEIEAGAVTSNPYEELVTQALMKTLAPAKEEK
jgi:hypothetical protein